MKDWILITLLAAVIGTLTSCTKEPERPRFKLKCDQIEREAVSAQGRAYVARCRKGLDR